MSIKDFFLGAVKPQSSAVTERVPNSLPNDLNMNVSADIVRSWYTAGGELDEGAAIAAEMLAENSEKQAKLSERVKNATKTVAKNEPIIVGNYLESKKAAEESLNKQTLLRARGQQRSAILQQTSAQALGAIANIGEGLR